MNGQLTTQEEEKLEKMMSMGRELGFEEAQRRYDRIPVPDSLDTLVRTTIQEHKEKKERSKKRAARRRSVRIAVRTLGSMAAAMLLLMIPLNTSEAFARQMQQIPVFGKLAEVLTIRSYSYEENGVNVNVQMPEIVAVTPQPGNKVTAFSLENDVAEAENNEECADEACYDGNSGDVCYDTVQGAGVTDFSAEVNAQIQEIVENYEADAKQRFAEYKEAFFATGGTQEEWAGRTCDVIVDYVVTYNTEDTLSLILTTSECWVASYEENHYYNLDMGSGEYLTLHDILGKDWVTICNESIDTQIEERLATDTEKMLCYWGYGEAVEDMYEAKFTTVDEETTFYINAQGNPVVCFAQYEIAPGYMGVQEFEITE